MEPKFYKAIFVLAAFFYEIAAYVEGPKRVENSVIPKTLQPSEYTLLFEVDMADKKHIFLGTVIIEFECVEPTREIILNTMDLFLDKDAETEKSLMKALKKLPDLQYEPLNLLEPTKDPEKNWLVIGLEKELQKEDKIQIEINYHKLADLSKDPNAVFVKYSYFRKVDGDLKWVAVSMPGAINSRALYPCIDNPGVKSNFQLHVAHDDKLISLSNSRVHKESIRRIRPGIVSEPFYITPSLSPFSIGFVVGDLKSIVRNDFSSGLTIQVSSDEAVIEQMEFAADTAVEIVKFYKGYFKSVHAIVQIDLVALPFYGRTDKWKYGLIILEETLIINENPSTHVRQTETVFTLCDVFCHQYFGPQTTLQTWSENWLNMGLALFYRIPCLENVSKNEKTSIANIQLVESFIRVLSFDAEIKSRPLMVSDSRVNLSILFKDTILAETGWLYTNMSTPYEARIHIDDGRNSAAQRIDQRAACASYWCKAGFRRSEPTWHLYNFNSAHFLVRMMSYILGKDELTEQVKKYISEYRLKVTSLEKLWENFPLGEKNSQLLPEDMTFKGVIESWTYKEGFAHIKITRDQKNKIVTIQVSLADSETSTRIIPLNFVTKTEVTEKATEESEAKKKSTSKKEAAKRPTKKSDPKETVQYWLHSPSVPIEIPVETSDWIILSSKLNVLCRVEYDPLTLKLIKNTLMNKKKYELIDVTTRTQFISDLFASAEMGKLSYSTVFKFVGYLRHEKSVLPVLAALYELNRIRLALFGTQIFSAFQGYILGILKFIIEKRKFKIKDISEENYEEYYLKKLIFTLACTFGDENCIKQSKAHFATLLKDGNLSGTTDPIPVALREPFYCQAIKAGNDVEWNFLMAFYSSKNWENLNDTILNALSCTTSDNIITKYLKRILDSEKIAPRDRLTVFKSVASNEKGHALMRIFFQDNVDVIVDMYSTAIDPSEAYRYLEILYENTWKQEDFDET